MDASGFESIILKEVILWGGALGPQAVIANSLRFQNHIYGCMSILELLAEKTADLSGTTIITDITTFDLSDNFKTVGCEFGFFQDARGVFEIWADDYKDAWIWAWTNIRSLETVDKIEHDLFAHMQEFEFFQAAMENGELNEEMENKALSLYEFKSRRRYSGNTRRKQQTLSSNHKRIKTRKSVRFAL
jgi:hypothetical protein